MRITKKQAALEEIWRERLMAFRDRYGEKVDIHQYVDEQLKLGVVIVHYRLTWNGPYMTGVVAFGDRFDRDKVYILDEHGQDIKVPKSKFWCQYPYGGIRKIYFPRGVYMGRTSLMARVGIGIRSGRMFRGGRG